MRLGLWVVLWGAGVVGVASQGSTLRPPLPPVKVVAAAGLVQDHTRHYTFLSDDQRGSESFASKDPFDMPSLETIARLMREREGEGERRGGEPPRGWGREKPSSAGGVWSSERPSNGWGQREKPTHGWGRPSERPTSGWGGRERPTEPRGWGRPPPPPTQGWGWSKQDNTTWGPPPERWTTTRRWEGRPSGGWQSREDPPWQPTTEGRGGGGWGQGSYTVVNKDEQRQQWGSYDSRSEEKQHGGGGWGAPSSTRGWGPPTTSGWGSPTTTRPAYTPQYLSSDEEKYKPIRYPSSEPPHSGWGHSSEPPQSGWGQQSSHDHPPHHKPPSHHHEGSSGGGWGHHQNSLWPTTEKPSWPHHNWPAKYPHHPSGPHESHEAAGSGWPRPLHPPPKSQDGWGSREKEQEGPPLGPFEYRPGVDDLRKYQPANPYMHIRDDYPPGVSPPGPSEEDDLFPERPNHYRLVNYTPSPEERLEILKKLREKGRSKDDDSPFFDPSKVTNDDLSKVNKTGTQEEDSREKWFVHNFQRGGSKTTSKSTTRLTPTEETTTTRGTTTTTTTRSPETTERSRRNSGIVRGGSSSAGVGGGGKRPRYDSQGFKYIPAGDPLAKRLGDIYEKPEDDDFGRTRRGERFEGAASSQSVLRRMPGRIDLWNGNEGSPPGGIKRGGALRLALDKDIGRSRAALMDRKKNGTSSEEKVLEKCSGEGETCKGASTSTTPKPTSSSRKTTTPSTKGTKGSSKPTVALKRVYSSLKTTKKAVTTTTTSPRSTKPLPRATKRVTSTTTVKPTSLKTSSVSTKGVKTLEELKAAAAKLKDRNARSA